MILVLVGGCHATSAQSCQIKGATDGSSVMVTNHWESGSSVFVNLENDSEKTCANVVVKVQVKYVYSGNHIVGGPGPKTKIFEGKGTSCPNGSCKIEVPILLDFKDGGDYFVKKGDYEIIGISGNKCN